MAGNRNGATGSGKDFTFVNSFVKYLLFFFNLMFWVISLLMVAVGIYARTVKHAEATLTSLSLDPAVMLIVVGVLIFLVTFCGCVGSLRENICLLQIFCISLVVIFIIQLAAGVLSFIFSNKARQKVTEVINDAIVHYRDDADLQNLIDFGQEEFGCCGAATYLDWSNNIYFHCNQTNPSRERCSVPFSCCILSRNESVVNTMCGQGMQEREFAEAGKEIHTSGCIDILDDFIHSNMIVLGGIALGLAVPELVGMILSQLLINQIKQQIELQQYNLNHSSDPWS
ncbi:PREDICTED: tetraspanin-33 [Poecilia mexicana]|uniref:Tetraspanin n=1 Tax=Poecilia mexicana TaxID=48701 RepID=A0A3B3Y2F8_9TELE|nr:PREDICTED: tetraspanin-33 [Poecilia mexicana]